MSYQVTDEQVQLRSVVADLLSTRGHPRAAYDGGPARDRDLWKQLGELGLVGLSLSADLGGAAGTLMDETVMAEQVGATTACVPIVTSSVASTLLSMLGSPAAKATAAAATDGTTVVLVAISAASGFGLDFTAQRNGDQWRVSGSANDLLEAASADILIVAADAGGADVGGAGSGRADAAGGLAWFALDVHAAGVELLDQPSLDPTQRLGAVTATDANATMLAGVDTNGAGRLIERAWVLLGAQAVGAAAHALDITVEYAKHRHAFGQPIGRFQAIKHRLAECLVAVENARSAVYNAAWAIDAGRPDAHRAARMAKAVATENAVHVIHDAIQCHGGIGFTWEHDLHLYLRRAKSTQLVLGSPDEHFEALGRSLLDQLRDPAGMKG